MTDSDDPSTMGRRRHIVRLALFAAFLVGLFQGVSTLAVTTFANGYLFRVATLGDSQVASAAQLKRYLHALVAGLALEHNPKS